LVSKGPHSRSLYSRWPLISIYSVPGNRASIHPPPSSLVGAAATPRCDRFGFPVAATATDGGGAVEPSDKSTGRFEFETAEHVLHVLSCVPPRPTPS
jgi:hypothetical protein